MVASWGQTGQVYAGLNLGFDFLFIVTYPAAIGLGCVLVARALAQRVAFLASIGVALAWAQLVAGVLECVENYALIQVLLGAQQEMLPVVAAWCAAPKFAIVGVGIAYVLVGAVGVGAVKARGRDENLAKGKQSKSGGRLARREPLYHFVCRMMFVPI